jgi:hypothetical protein
MSCSIGVCGRSTITSVVGSVAARMTVCGWNGCRPLPLQAELIFEVEKAAALAFIYASSHSAFCIRRSCASFRCKRAVVRCCFKGLKIEILSGCRT